MMDQPIQWWNHIDPERIIPRTTEHGAYTQHCRYYGNGYSTVNPDALWKEILRMLRRTAEPTFFRLPNDRGWELDCCRITDPDLAMRIFHILLKYRGVTDSCLKHHLSRQAGFSKH